MILFDYRLALFVIIFFASGCTIGNWRICGPQTPAIYCDAKALDALLNPRPYIDLWEKPGVSAAEKKSDWVECGGKTDGDFVPTEAMIAVWRSSEGASKLSAYQMASAQFQRCFLGKGYVWTGRCEYESSKLFPVCGAP